jgi:hypothetical protein
MLCITSPVWSPRGVVPVWFGVPAEGWVSRLLLVGGVLALAAAGWTVVRRLAHTPDA